MLNNEQNIDPAERDQFDALAETWWDKDGQLKTLHVINPVRLQYITDAVKLDNKQVLDVGCGGGLLSEAMARESARVTGIDISQSAIDIARQHSSRNDLTIDYQTSTIEQFADDHNRQFDILTCMEMLEHVPDPGSILKSAAELLKPGGHLFLSTINRSLKSYLGTIIAAEYLLGLLPRGTHHYAGFIRPSELCRWLRSYGFRIQNISGMNYMPFINYASLTDKPTVNYLIHARLDD